MQAVTWVITKNSCDVNISFVTTTTTTWIGKNSSDGAIFSAYSPEMLCCGAHVDDAGFSPACNILFFSMQLQLTKTEVFRLESIIKDVHVIVNYN